jgi:hypothetical protein
LPISGKPEIGGAPEDKLREIRGQNGRPAFRGVLEGLHARYDTPPD